MFFAEFGPRFDGWDMGIYIVFFEIADGILRFYEVSVGKCRMSTTEYRPPPAGCPIFRSKLRDAPGLPNPGIEHFLDISRIS